MEVIPVLNCLDKHEADEKIKVLHAILPSGGWIHLDVADGRFTYHKSWADPHAWEKLAWSVKLEVHLMVEEPEHAVPVWIKAGAKRIIVHLETVPNMEHIIEECKNAGVELMLATNPETPVVRLEPYFKTISEFQVLAVHPGLAGQKFLPLTMEKVKLLRKEMPHARIEVDGGITAETARVAKAAGADAVACGTFIFTSDDPKLAFSMLQHI